MIWFSPRNNDFSKSYFYENHYQSKLFFWLGDVKIFLVVRLEGYNKSNSNFPTSLGLWTIETKMFISQPPTLKICSPVRWFLHLFFICIYLSSSCIDIFEHKAFCVFSNVLRWIWWNQCSQTSLLHVIRYFSPSWLIVKVQSEIFSANLMKKWILDKNFLVLVLCIQLYVSALQLKQLFPIRFWSV